MRLLGFYIIGLLLVGCTTTADYKAEKRLRWNLNSEPKTIDPQLNAAVDGSDVINHLHEGLLREVGSVLRPALAKRWTVSDDGLTYRFYLKKSFWSNGEPLTAHDFEYSWKRGVNPETASEFSHIFYMIENAEAVNQGKMPLDSMGVKALSDTILEVVLRAPTEYFLSVLASATYQPVYKPAVLSGPRGAWAKDPKISVTNGPFTLADYRLGDRMVLAKNPHYHLADSVSIEQIDLFMITEASTGLTAYESGDLHVVDNPPEQEILRLMNQDEGFAILPLLGVYYYTLNLNEAVFQDIRVRKALAYSIDRNRIANIVLKGGQKPAQGMVPLGLNDHQGNAFAARAAEYGIPTGTEKFKEAAALLAEAGYPNGDGFPPVEITYNTSEAHKAVAEAIQQMWQKNLGIEVGLSNSEWAVFQEKRIQNDFQIARGGWISDFPDPVNFLDIYRSTSVQNYGQWSNLTYDSLLQASDTTRHATRFNYLYKAHEVLVKDYAAIPIYYYTDPVLVDPDVVGWEKTSMGNFWFGFARFKD